MASRRQTVLAVRKSIALIAASLHAVAWCSTEDSRTGELQSPRETTVAPSEALSMNTDQSQHGSAKEPSPAAIHPSPPSSLRAVHTPNFPELLRRLGASLLVTTYQAGKLVMVRDEGDHLNTHFRAFQAPMGLALAARSAGDRHVGADLGVCRRPGGDGQARAGRPPRRLFPAALVPHHGQRADPRDGLGQRRGALVRQHSLLVPVHARPLGQLHAAVAAAVCDGPRADRPLPLERPGDGRRPPALRDGPGPDRRAGRLAAGEGDAAGS